MHACPGDMHAPREAAWPVAHRGCRAGLFAGRSAVLSVTGAVIDSTACPARTRVDLDPDPTEFTRCLQVFRGTLQRGGGCGVACDQLGAHGLSVVARDEHPHVAQVWVAQAHVEPRRRWCPEHAQPVHRLHEHGLCRPLGAIGDDRRRAPGRIPGALGATRDAERARSGEWGVQAGGGA